MLGTVLTIFSLLQANQNNIFDSAYVAWLWHKRRHAKAKLNQNKALTAKL